MRNEDIRDLLHAWALDAVDPAESAAVERAIREDPSLADDARALREVVGLLALDARAEPPASLRDDVLDQIARTPQESAPGAVRRADEQVAGSSAPADVADAASSDPAEQDGVVSLTRVRARRRDRWLAAAAVLVAAAVPTVLAVQQQQRADEAEQQLATVAEALARPGAELVAQDVTGGGRAVAVLSEDTSVFAARGLSALPEDEDYQLWVVLDGAATSQGVLTVAEGETSAEVEELPAGAVLAMTVEPAGGSPQPTSDPVVALAAGG